MAQGSGSVTSLVDLPEVIQTIATQRRTGTLVVSSRDQIRRLYFTNGQIIALNGAAPKLFAQCLTWSGLLKPEALNQCLTQVGASYSEVSLIEFAQSKGLINRDLLLDALDTYAEESLTELVGWNDSQCQFLTKQAADQWAAFQVKLGVSIAPGGILLEALRRTDELKSLSAHIPDRWDVLLRDPAAVTAGTDLDDDQRIIMANWKNGRSADELLSLPTLSPFRVKTAIARLRKSSLLKLGGPMDIVVQADAANSHQEHDKAYQLYLRAVELGMESPRIHLHIAELAEQLGDNAMAATYYLKASAILADPGSSVIALRNALRLGAEKEDPLRQLLQIYLHLDEKDDAMAVLLDLAAVYEGRKAHDEAAQAVHEALELGADPAACAGILARLATAEGDTEQAVLQYELVARAAEDRGRVEEAVEALTHLCRLQPKRFEHAHKLAELLVELGRAPEAVAELSRILAYKDEAGEEVLIGLYELKARLDQDDVVAHQWLADAYRRRKNRDGATEQLKMLAAAQEREGSYPELAVTLERILEVGGDQVDVLKRLALVYSRLGMEGKASSTLARAVDAALALGNLDEARTMCEVALDLDPASLPLRIRFANVANRAGDREVAEENYRAAADLARGQGKPDVAHQQLIQLRKLRPDDIHIRIELADLARRLEDPNLDVILRDLVMFAVKGRNFGIAVEHAKLRVLRQEGKAAFAARSELVELFRRMGDHVTELSTGKELLNDLIEQGEFEPAVELLQRLVASNPRNSELVLQLAEMCESFGDERQAQRFYRHGSSLLQVEGRIKEANDALDHLERLGESPEAMVMARDLLSRSQPLEWEAIRWSLEQDHRRRLAGELEVSGQHRQV